MALLITWISLGTCLILSVAWVALVYDGRGQRKALGIAQQSIAALQRRVAAQDEQIGSLRALLGPPATAPEQALVLPASTQRRAPSTIRRTVIVVTPESDDLRADAACDEANLRALLRSRPLRGDDATLAESLRQKFRGILDEERYVNVRHCAGAACTPGAWDTCACSCAACRARRYALSRAQRIYGNHVPFVRLPDEEPETWALRLADEEAGK